MQTYEFYAELEDGKITVPSIYQDELPTNVKVILLAPQTGGRPTPKGARKSELLLPPMPGLTQFTFDREEANAR